MLSPQSLQFGMSLLMMACVPFSSPGQWRLKTKEVSDFSVLRNDLTRSSLLTRHPDREMVYCKRACHRWFYMMSAFGHLLHLSCMQGPSCPPWSPTAGSLPIGSGSARGLLSLDGGCLIGTKIMPKTDARLTSSLGQGPPASGACPRGVPKAQESPVRGPRVCGIPTCPP